jgi:hypothetical protein
MVVFQSDDQKSRALIVMTTPGILVRFGLEAGLRCKMDEWRFLAQARAQCRACERPQTAALQTLTPERRFRSAPHYRHSPLNIGSSAVTRATSTAEIP